VIATWHLYRDGEPYTLLVYGPYLDGDFDVEIYLDHVDEATRNGVELIGTVSLNRDTHIVADCQQAVRIAMYDHRCNVADANLDPFGRYAV
jgi:hypothetical protein